MSFRYLWCFAVAGICCLGPGCDQQKPPSAPDGSVTVTAADFDAVEKAIADAKGKVVLIDCWATWCGPCVQSFPELVAKHRKYKDQGLFVISLSLDEKEKIRDVEKFLQRRQANFTNFLLLPGPTAARGLEERLRYQGGIPHGALFDRAGNLAWSGHPMDETLTWKIETELAKTNLITGDLP